MIEPSEPAAPSSRRATQRRRSRSALGRRRRLGQAFAEMHYQLRTEGDTPLRTAGSIWLGTFIGVSPYWGLHLAMVIGLSKLFGVSRIKAYLAAHFNNPLTFPFLTYASMGIGHWIWHGAWSPLTLDQLRDLDGAGLLGLGRDYFIGAHVVGFGLGAVFAAASLAIRTVWRSHPFAATLKEESSRPYVETGIFNWEFVRAKLRRDPAYFGILRSGLLPDEGRLLDLGCGRGLLLSLIRTAQSIHERGEWPSHWPEPPSRLDLVGFERDRRLAAISRRVLGDRATLRVEDLRIATLPPSDAIILLDVLHHLEPAEQEDLLQKVADAIRPGGLLLIREVDTRRGWRAWSSRVANRCRAIARRRWRQRFHYRPIVEWATLLRARGLALKSYPMWSGTPYADVLIEARRVGTAAAERPRYTLIPGDAGGSPAGRG